MIHYDPVWAIYEGAVASTLDAMAATPDAAARITRSESAPGGNVAVIPITGPLMRRETWFGSGIENVREDFLRAERDPAVTDIVLRIDSPGGTTAGLERLGATIAAAQKHVTAVVDGMAASAAYWIASQTDRIVAGKSDLVGSIGVRLMLVDASKAFADAGLRAIPVDTGPHKSAGALGTEITDEQVAEFRKIVDYHYDLFVDAVAAGRGLSRDAVFAAADGRVFTLPAALALGLVDDVGSVDDVVTSLHRVSTESRRLRLDKTRRG